MESVQISDLEVFLVRQILNNFVNVVYFILTLAFCEVFILHLVQRKKYSVEADMMDVLQEGGSSLQASRHLLFLHDSLVFQESVCDALQLSSQLSFFFFLLGYLISHFCS